MLDNALHIKNALAGEDTLAWAANRKGIRFCLVYPPSANVSSPGKHPIGNNWENRPYGLEEATKHLAGGGNVGMLCGPHSVYLYLLDVDRKYGEFLARYPEYATAPAFVRLDPDTGELADKGKIVVSIDASIKGKKFRLPDHPSDDRSPDFEVLGVGNQGVIAGTHPAGVEYLLINPDGDIPYLTIEELDELCLGWTGQPYIEPEPERLPEHVPQTKKYNGQGDGLRDAVIEAWTPSAVFKHFGRDQNGTEPKDRKGFTRILGNGGLFVHENDKVWYTFDGELAGDAISAWVYCESGAVNVPTGREFTDLLKRMAGAANISIDNPNGNHPSSSPHSEAGGQPTPQPSGEVAETEVEGRDKRILSTEYIEVLKKMGYEFRLCELDDVLWVNGERISDPKVAEIKTKLRDAGYPKVGIAADAYLAHGLKNSFHPMKDYLNSLEWDGQDHITRLIDHIGEEKHDTLHLVMRKWLIGAVARPFTNGKQNRVLVLVGRQGTGKSTLVRWLGSPLPNHFSESTPNPDDKDSHIRLATTWVWEIKEIGSVTRRADREALKSFLSLEWINERKAFGKYDIHKPATASFIATVNPKEGGFFNDPTGSRRYMTAAVSYISWDYEKDINVNQVWAQAKHLFDGGEDWNLTPKEQSMIETVNDEYEFAPPVYDWLNIVINPSPGSFTPSSSILEAARRDGLVGANDKGISREIAGWMGKNGYSDSPMPYIEVATVDKNGKAVKTKKRTRGYHDCELHNKVSSWSRDGQVQS